MRHLSPSSLCPTHFGRFEDVARHLSELEQRLEHWLLFVEERMDDDASREEIAFDLENMGDEELLREGASPEDTDRYSLAGNYEMLVAGIMRYVQRQRERK